jgi:hypothetical protein
MPVRDRRERRVGSLTAAASAAWRERISSCKFSFTSHTLTFIPLNVRGGSQMAMNLDD